MWRRSSCPYPGPEAGCSVPPQIRSRTAAITGNFRSLFISLFQQDFSVAAGEGAAGEGRDGSVVGIKCEGAGVQGCKVLLQRTLLLPVEYPSGAGGGEGTLQGTAVGTECGNGAAGGEVFKVFLTSSLFCAII